jgi:hypothetical protein
VGARDLYAIKVGAQPGKVGDRRAGGRCAQNFHKVGDGRLPCARGLVVAKTAVVVIHVGIIAHKLICCGLLASVAISECWDPGLRTDVAILSRDWLWALRISPKREWLRVGSGLKELYVAASEHLAVWAEAIPWDTTPGTFPGRRILGPSATGRLTLQFGGVTLGKLLRETLCTP